MDDELSAALEGAVGDRVHVAHDHVRLVAGLDERVGAAVDAHEDGPEVADVRLDDPQVALHPRAAGDDERVPVAEAGLHLREPHALGEKLRLVAKVAQRVLGEALERLGDSAALLRELRFELALRQCAADREPGAVAEETRTADDQRLAVTYLLEKVRLAVYVDEPHAAADKLQRAGVRESAAHGR
jgi:hypothetical protein